MKRGLTGGVMVAPRPPVPVLAEQFFSLEILDQRSGYWLLDIIKLAFICEAGGFLIWGIAQYITLGEVKSYPDPIAGELLFRVLIVAPLLETTWLPIFTLFLRKWKPIHIAIVAGIITGLYHTNQTFGFSHAWAGLVWAYLYASGRGFFTTVSVHFMYNLIWVGRQYAEAWLPSGLQCYVIDILWCFTEIPYWSSMAMVNSAAFLFYYYNLFKLFILPINQTLWSIL